MCYCYVPPNRDDLTPKIASKAYDDNDDKDDDDDSKGALDNDPALTSAGTLLSRVRAPLTASLPDGVPESLRWDCRASPQQGDLRLSGPLSGQGAGGGARPLDRRIPADIQADSLATVPPACGVKR
ncbi:hypothetical protein PoB_000788700 [Plakobranchus ocellatus]|uniref:Uncharacterized protein n=1 Tax=Plakobranchus ocellatus TaxID=259542 RepID=A0AAV3YGN3_9GAST|nr:hypothetical protein PoB_000788700 [Plakobranchus ocellatus]